MATNIEPTNNVNVPTNATGTNYRQLGIALAIMVFITLFVCVYYWYSNIIYPQSGILNTEPFRSEIPMDVIPLLPEELGVAYDGLRAGQLALLNDPAVTNVDERTARIAYDDAVTIMLGEEMFPVRAADEETDGDG